MANKPRCPFLLTIILSSDVMYFNTTQYNGTQQLSSILSAHAYPEILSPQHLPGLYQVKELGLSFQNIYDTWENRRSNP